jgi:hypothetical protein
VANQLFGHGLMVTTPCIRSQARTPTRRHRNQRQAASSFPPKSIACFDGITMSSVAPPHQTCEALQPIRYYPITNQLSTLGDNCNDMLCFIPSTL